MNGFTADMSWRSNRAAFGLRGHFLGGNRLHWLPEAGLVQPLGDHWNALVLALAGVDRILGTDRWFAAVAGARAAIEWAPSSLAYGLSLTAVDDLTTARDERGRQVTGFAALLTLSVTVPLRVWE